MTDHDLDLLLADLNDDVPPMTDEAFEAGRARLAEVGDAAVLPASWSSAQEEHARLHVLRSPPRRLAVLATAAAAVAAVVGGVVLAGDSETVTPAVVNSPSQLVVWARGLADNPPIVGPDQYRYVRARYSYEFSPNEDPRFRIISSVDSETWIPYDYRDEWRSKKGQVRNDFLRGTEEEAVAAGAFTQGITTAPGGIAKCGDFEPLGHGTELVPRPGPCEGDGWSGPGSPEWFHEWSNPQKLYNEIHRQAVGRGPGLGPEMFVQTRDDLLDGNMTYEFKAALYEALSRTPGLVVLDQAKTSDGRTGIGLRVADNGTTELWVLDRETGDPLELVETTRVSESRDTTTYGVTDSMNKTPAR